ncbi:hypothetical protein Q5424_13900 [Conexibacter sp. JD483]|uniref:hypothetical protein n=1 Tax=unclassified Conexibacter TaxID=2627773 RepID=UPI00271CB77F|nr:MULTISPECIES: hypothetical protein [unclassified Conexibacter]MDO8185503.1 hypothetical protein [Conexibacter sp. CPCC 205706]MDO8197310.1 hypothetical protein [Conexibacter sp. CPCC 205762]MDR9370190.1 hypothetical protein [Conexibacter sp. JD483]
MIERDFGPFRFTVEPQEQEVAVRLTYAGAPLWNGSFRPIAAAQAPLLVEIDTGISASATLTAEFGAAGSSQLHADELQLRAPGYETTFTGTVAFW